MDILQGITPSQVHKTDDKKVKISVRVGKSPGLVGLVGTEDPFSIANGSKVPLAIVSSKEGVGRVEQLKQEMQERVEQIRDQHKHGRISSSSHHHKSTSPVRKNNDHSSSTHRRSPSKRSILPAVSMTTMSGNAEVDPQILNEMHASAGERISSNDTVDHSNTINALLSPRRSKKSVGYRSVSLRDVKQNPTSLSLSVSPRKAASLRRVMGGGIKTLPKLPIQVSPVSASTKVDNVPASVKEAEEKVTEQPSSNEPTRAEPVLSSVYSSDDTSASETSYEDDDDEIIKVRPDTKKHLVAAQLQIPGLLDSNEDKEAENDDLGVQYEDISVVYNF
jgi:hypothetical protein